MGKLWGIIEDWRNAMEFPPSYRQIALKLKVSQSTFDTWKRPEKMPEARNLYGIHELTGRPFVDVVQAAIDDTELFNAEKAREMRDAHLEKLAPVAGQLARMQEKVTKLETRRRTKTSPPDESVVPAADDVDRSVDESPGGSDPNE